jgi:hypothetical protein
MFRAQPRRQTIGLISAAQGILARGGTMLRTQLCDLLDIEVPVMGAPMGPEITSLAPGRRKNLLRPMRQLGVSTSRKARGDKSVFWQRI